MPVLLRVRTTDGEESLLRLPPQVWQKGDRLISKLLVLDGAGEPAARPLRGAPPTPTRPTTTASAHQRGAPAGSRRGGAVVAARTPCGRRAREAARASEQDGE